MLLAAFPQDTLAALAAGTQFQISASATTGNVNGSGFNNANAGMLTNFTATAANTSAPVVASASYNFAAGDVGSWFYTQSGTNWTPSWCKIASVATNAATLTAGVGQCITSIGPQGVVTTNAAAGIATTASPTAGVGTVDYSQQNTAQITGTDGIQTAASTTFTVTSETFTPVMVGNLLHITACTGTGCITGWYEIVTYVNALSVTLDRTATNGVNNITASTFFVGGAGRLNALESAFQGMLPASSITWIQNGSYTISAALSTANTNSTSILQSYFLGFNSVRGDNPVGSNRPVINMGANIWTGVQGVAFGNMIFTGTGTTVLISGAQSAGIYNVKISNTSSTAARIAYTFTGGGAAIGSELISLNGTALNNGSGAQTAAIGNYIHDSSTGYTSNSAATVIGNIFEANTTAAITLSLGGVQDEVLDNTIYGDESKLGIGVNLTSANNSPNLLINNIFYGLTTAISQNTGLAGRNVSLYNDFFNNTTDTSFWSKGSTDLAVNPTFTGASQLSGTTATSSGSVLTDAGASFGVTDNTDVLHVVSGTGATVGNYLITSHTGTTLTVNNAIGTSSGGNLVYFVTHGHNFQIGTNLKATGFNAFTNTTGGGTTSYPDTGAVQRQETGGGASGVFGYGAP